MLAAEIYHVRDRRRALGDGCFEFLRRRRAGFPARIDDLRAGRRHAAVVHVVLRALHQDFAALARFGQLMENFLAVERQHAGRAFLQRAGRAVGNVGRLVMGQTGDRVARLFLHLVKIHAVARNLVHGAQAALGHAARAVFGKGILRVDITVQVQFFKDIHLLSPFFQTDSRSPRNAPASSLRPRSRRSWRTRRSPRR